jgi:hypothetical protein
MSVAVTTSVLGLDEDTRRLVDAVVRNLVANQAGAGSRDLAADVTRAPSETGVATATSQDAQRLFGGILETVINVVIPKVTPHILTLLQQRRRELSLPEQRNADVVERDLRSIIGALLPKLVAAIPGIVSAITGQPAPRSREEEGQRFLPFLAALIPAVVSAVPSIIGAFNQQRGVDETPPITDPDVAQRFFGPLLSAFVPDLLQAAPTILGSIFGGRRDVAATAW